ncbi:hypothetical protein BJX66DRAFT_295136 [Aspergillus keveii]|uniref:C2H2-type domain-containing protein n=1 Tax=Aspergillus keveii TaxID=714993 RepID=A0ABR4GHV8_9EURO
MMGYCTPYSCYYCLSPTADVSSMHAHVQSRAHTTNCSTIQGFGAHRWGQFFHFSALPLGLFGLSSFSPPILASG